MEQLFIGELIRQRRLELGLKQCELCEGICEPVTMSRLESGKQTPGSNKLRMLDAAPWTSRGTILCTSKQK